MPKFLQFAILVVKCKNITLENRSKVGNNNSEYLR